MYYDEYYQFYIKNNQEPIWKLKHPTKLSVWYFVYYRYHPPSPELLREKRKSVTSKHSLTREFYNNTLFYLTCVRTARTV